jgi:diguanylate cyclase (GGDEF)-like protein
VARVVPFDKESASDDVVATDHEAPATFAGRVWRRLGSIRPAYLVIAAAAIVLQVSLFAVDAFDSIYDFSRRHESWQLDEFFTVFFVLTLVFAAVLAVRANDMRREIIRRKEAERNAELLARHDSLTGLANRRLFEEEFDRRIAGYRASDARMAVMLLDLDRFKAVNDTYGHRAGDRLLREVADRLVDAVRPQDFVARLGGDEFALLISDANEQDVVFRIAKRVLATIAEPFVTDSYRGDVTVSVGIAIYPGDGKDTDTLMQRADAAMYQAKASGRNTYAVFNKELDKLVRQRLEVELQLRDAIREGRIFAHYQPLIDLTTHKVVGFEALARWRHPTRGIVGAEEFIAIAEDAGLIGDIFSAVLHEACQNSRDWDPDLSLAVNVSPTQFRDPRLADRIFSILEETGVAPERLEIEITESALVVDVEATKRTIEGLKAKGIRIVLDDFGTGYSSLRHLHELPFDKIKIDQSFVRRLGADEESRKIIDSIIGLSHALGLITVAEGIETDQEAAWITEHGSELGQGFLFSRPVSAEDIPELIDGIRKRRRVVSA